MSTVQAAKFLGTFAQALSTMVLYGNGHPARERAVDVSFEALTRLEETDAAPVFSFLGHEVVYGMGVLRELKDWDWSARLANAGVQRLEFEHHPTREEYEGFLEQVLTRLSAFAVSTLDQRQMENRSSIRFGAVGVRGSALSGLARGDAPDELPTATIRYTLSEEAETVRWMHNEVQTRAQLPLIEAEAVVRSLSVAMHEGSEVVIPLLQLKEFDQYTTTHSLNVSVLSMALAEFLGLGGKDVRNYGVAGLLHDLGKTRIPKDILTKPGKLTDEEWVVMRRHPVDGAKIITASDRQLDLAAVVAYEHHIMLDGGGYPSPHFKRNCHHASQLVHVCDVYDALRTNRPYRAAWEPERALGYIEERGGSEFDPDLVRAFVAMMRQWERRVAVDEMVAPSVATAGGAAAVPARSSEAPASPAPTVISV